MSQNLSHNNGAVCGVSYQELGIRAMLGQLLQLHRKAVQCHLAIILVKLFLNHPEANTGVIGSQLNPFLAESIS